MKVTVMLIVVGALGIVPKVWEWGWKNCKKWNHTDHRIILIGHVTEKSPWDLRSLAVTETPMKGNAYEKNS